MSSRFCVLVVDDDFNLRSALMFRLSRGFELIEAASGAEALFHAVRTRPDLVIVDTHLSDWTGFETVRQLRNLPECAEIPIVMLTSDSLPETITSVKESGATDWIEKKMIEFPEFIDRLLGHLHGHKRVG